MRRSVDPACTPARDVYRLLTAVVVPRPIAWVSTVSADGVDNLAPHSFFTVACTDPPVVQFTSVGRKDSLRNVEETGEFVVCLAPEPLMEQVNATGTDFPAGTSEFDAVGLEREPSERVRPPRVAASPVALECVLHSTVRLGNSTVVFGRVVWAAVDESAYAPVEEGADPPAYPRVDVLAPLSRLGGDEWGATRDVRTISRIPYARWAAECRDA